MGGGGGNQFSMSLRQSRASSLLRGLQVPPFLSCTKSRDTLSGKHSHEPQECSVAEQELQEGVPGWRCFCPSASSQLLAQAGRQEVMGSQQDGHGRDTARVQRYPCTAKHRVTLEKDKKS